MVKAVRIYRNGGPEVLELEEVDIPAPGPGEVRIRHTAIGLNFIDVYMRRGANHPHAGNDFPFTLGMEGAGVVEALGPDVTSLAPGDRIAYCMVRGSYAEARNIAADRLVRIPEAIEDEQAAAAMLQGLTAHYLLHTTYPVQPGDTILVHAAAGGVGLLLCQWAHHLGATVIGTVGNPAKAELAQANGCAHTILYREEDFVARVKELTERRGVAAVYDSVGADTIERGFHCLRPRGVMASFGQSSGPVPLLDTSVLSARGSLYLTRTGLITHVQRRGDLEMRSRALFDALSQGILSVRVDQRHDLADIRRAHEDLEARRTTGSTVILP